MEQIFVESSKSYKSGFLIKEAELRRIVDLINEQFRKLSTEAIVFDYILKYKNGAVASTRDLDFVLKQENEGSESIVRLEIKASQSNNGKESVINLMFRNLDLSDEENDVSIKHFIKGQSRDWVFISSSLIEERITKIKRKQLDPTKSNGASKIIFKLITPIIMFALIIGMTISMPDAIKSINEKKSKAIAELESKWQNGSIKDPIEAIIFIERSNTSADGDLTLTTLLWSVFFTKSFIIIACTVLIVLTLFIAIAKYYPTYNFYWGGYVETFDKKENIRKILIGILLGTIILGIFVNLLSNIIWDNI